MRKFKLLLFIGLLGLWAPVSFGQTTGKVYYTSILESENFKEIIGVTIFKGDFSSFYFPNFSQKSSNTEETSVTQKDPFNMRIKIKLGDPLSSYMNVFIDRKKHKIISREQYFADGDMQNCLTVESLGPMEWEITGEKKTIDAFEAIKARTDFRGRSYTAWFTTDIPIDIGPWKFHGLPGLILEVYDEEKGVKFYMSEIQIPVELDKKIVPPSAPEQLTIQEYASLEQNFEKEFIEMIQSKLPRGTNVGNIKVQKGQSRGIEREFNFADSKTNE